MNIFQPYQFVQDSAKCIELKVTKTRERLFYFTFRVMPIVFCGNAFALFWLQKTPQTYFLNGLAVLVVMLAAMFWFQQPIFSVTITPSWISLVRLKYNGKEEIIFATQDADYIQVSMSGGKGGGIFYKLKLKSGKKIPILTIPVLYMSRKQKEAISQRLQQLTQLSIQEV